MPVSTTGWRIVHVILGVLFVDRRDLGARAPAQRVRDAGCAGRLLPAVQGGLRPHRRLLTKGQFDLWWLQLGLGIVEIALAFWVAGSFRESAILLVVYVGVIALMRGITELFLAFKLKGLGRRRLAPA